MRVSDSYEIAVKQARLEVHDAKQMLERILEFSSITRGTWMAIHTGRPGRQSWIAKYEGFAGFGGRYKVSGSSALDVRTLLSMDNNSSAKVPKIFQKRPRDIAFGLVKAYSPFELITSDCGLTFGENIDEALRWYGFTLEDCKRASKHYYKSK